MTAKETLHSYMWLNKRLKELLHHSANVYPQLTLDFALNTLGLESLLLYLLAL